MCYVTMAHKYRSEGGNDFVRFRSEQKVSNTKELHCFTIDKLYSRYLVSVVFKKMYGRTLWILSFLSTLLTGDFLMMLMY